MLQITDTVLYLVAGLVIYRYSGQDVKSPAPSSAGPLMKRICFGLAIPTVCFALFAFWLNIFLICLFQSRSTLLALLSVTLLANMFMFEFSVVRATCIETALWALERGLELQASFG